MRCIRTTGINHLAMVTPDMDATIRFWRDLIGLRLVACLGRPGYRHYFFEISETDMIAFFEWPEVLPAVPKDPGVPVKGPFVFDHVSIGVESDEDLWNLRDRLEAADVWVSEPIDHHFIHSIYTFDPNQISLEFSAPVAGVDIRKNPLITDPLPCAEAGKGADPVSGVFPEDFFRTPLNERIVYKGD